MFEFCNNEEVKKLFIFFLIFFVGKNFLALLILFSGLREKLVYFVKIYEVGKFLRDNIVIDVVFCDCFYQLLSYVSILIKDVFLSLLSIEMGGGVSGDKLMDLVYRMVLVLQVVEGSLKDYVILFLLFIEVFLEVAVYSSRRLVVIYVLEIVVVNWIKQIKVCYSMFIVYMNFKLFYNVCRLLWCLRYMYCYIFNKFLW